MDISELFNYCENVKLSTDSMLRRLAYEDLKMKYEHKIIVPKIHKKLQPILVVPALQMIAYYVAYKRGCEIDKPRNLAKSVTVE